MKLTKLQFKVLRVWLRYRAGGYSVSQWFRTCWLSWLLLVVMSGWSYYFVVPISAALGWVLVGLCAGAFLRDIGYYQVGRRTWPVTERVIDWKQVQELVDSHEKPVA